MMSNANAVTRRLGIATFGVNVGCVVVRNQNQKFCRPPNPTFTRLALLARQLKTHPIPAPAGDAHVIRSYLSEKHGNGCLTNMRLKDLFCNHFWKDITKTELRTRWHYLYGWVTYYAIQQQCLKCGRERWIQETGDNL
jgi:hypothetical protein